MDAEQRPRDRRQGGHKGHLPVAGTGREGQQRQHEHDDTVAEVGGARGEPQAVE